MKLEFLSSDPFDGAFLSRLQGDLGNAEFVRFVLGYVSESGLQRIGPDIITKLRDPRSFGVSTLDCSCGYAPLVDLQALVDRIRPPPHAKHGVLKYFLQHPPLNQAPEARFVHSKLVFMVVDLRGARRAVAYVGSHNWSQNALVGKGSSTPSLSNVEASVRIELDWDDTWLDLAESSLPLPANLSTVGRVVVDLLRHMQEVFAFYSSLDVKAPENQATFKEWKDCNCKDPAQPEFLKVIVANCALDDTGRGPWSGAVQGANAPYVGFLARLRVGDLVYMQCCDPDEAELTFESRATWQLLAWEGANDLARGATPWLLVCEPTSLGIDDKGGHQHDGFEWVVWDPDQALTSQGQALPKPTVVKLNAPRTGTAECFRLTPCVPGVNNSAFETARKPDGHVVLRVTAVRSAPVEVAQAARSSRPQNSAGGPARSGPPTLSGTPFREARATADDPDARYERDPVGIFAREPLSPKPWARGTLIFDDARTSRASTRAYRIAAPRDAGNPFGLAEKIRQEQRDRFGVDFHASRSVPATSEVELKRVVVSLESDMNQLLGPPRDTLIGGEGRFDYCAARNDEGEGADRTTEVAIARLKKRRTLPAEVLRAALALSDSVKLGRASKRSPQASRKSKESSE